MKKYVELYVLMIVFLGLLTVVVGQKQNLHMDEIYSYGSSNSFAPWMSYEEGITYGKGNTPYEDYMMVQYGERFEFSNVYINQTKDVHPPLYYFALHAVSSFFPDKFSIWYAGVINVFFSILTLAVTYALILEISKSKWLAIMTGLLFVFSAGILQANTFFRMYVMLMFFVVLNSYIYIRQEKELNNLFFLKIWLVALLGGMTHYYFYVFLFFQVGYVLLKRMKKRDYKVILKYAVTYLSAGVITIALYPAMLNHIFGGGYRGQESIANFFAATSYVDNIISRANQINKDVLGNIGLDHCIALLVLTLILLKRNKAEKNIIERLDILIVPAIGYFFLITKIEVSKSFWYFYPIYPIILICVVVALVESIRIIVRGNKKKIRAAVVIIGIIMTVNGLRSIEWRHIYLSGDVIAVSERYAENDCIFLYNSKAPACQNKFMEFKNYKTITFLSENRLGDLPTFIDDKKQFVIYFDEDIANLDTILNLIKPSNKELWTYEQILQYGGEAAYYFYNTA